MAVTETLMRFGEEIWKWTLWVKEIIVEAFSGEKVKFVENIKRNLFQENRQKSGKRLYETN